MRYYIEVSTSESLRDATEYLTEKVNKLLDEGYVLVGGVSISLAEDQSSGRKRHYTTQALKKET